MLNNKKAGMGEAMTWVVATIIIFVVLAIFIYAAGAMGKIKTITISVGEVEVDVNSQLSIKTELALEKSNYAKEDMIKNWTKGVETYG